MIYTTQDGSKKATISVDLYESTTDASSAYHKAVEKSKTVAGFKPIAISDLGQQAFAGSVTQGAETHVGLGMLDGKLIVGLTLAGYENAPTNITKLIALAHEENTAAKAATTSGSR
jgi:hypothetical protein